MTTPRYGSYHESKISAFSGADASPASDRYALAVIAYEMLSGKRAFKADSTPGTLAAVINLDPTPLAKVVLLILLLFSAVSWGVILYKIWIYRRAERQSATFLNVFRKSTKFSEVQSICASVPY